MNTAQQMNNHRAKKWIIIAPGAEDFVVLSFENNQYASKTPKPGPGFASIIYIMDFPVSSACSVPIGVNIPWLIALFKNNTFAGSINQPMEVIYC